MEQSQSVEEKIKSDSAIIDGQFIDVPNESFRSYSLVLPVPDQHTRAAFITGTMFAVASLADTPTPQNSYYMVDASLRGKPIAESLGDNVQFIEVAEDSLKEISWLTNFVNNDAPLSPSSVIGIGGGVLLNAAAFVAEKRGVDFISIPTTVLAAADSAIGGLVRLNKVEDGQIQRSFYRSVYEPSKIILDPAALASLPGNQISFGLSEVVKHGVYQSTPLLEYLAGDDFDPFNNIDSLFKAICWTVALKNVDIIHDPDSKSFGGTVLRGGHELAWSIEEESRFAVSHGEAVAIGVYQDTLHNPEKLALLNTIYSKLGLPKVQSDLSPR